MNGTSALLDLSSLNGMDRASFVRALGHVFEHSPWIAEQAWDRRSFATIDELHRAMLDVVESADDERQLALFRAHPELAGKEAATGALTIDSRIEQVSAGLDRCSAEELVQLRELNRRYREQFGFPFIMAVKGRAKSEIFAALNACLAHDVGEERRRCLEEIAKITRFRLDATIAQ